VLASADWKPVVGGGANVGPTGALECWKPIVGGGPSFGAFIDTEGFASSAGASNPAVGGGAVDGAAGWKVGGACMLGWNPVVDGGARVGTDAVGAVPC
jgi:hypothetical protein